MKLVGLSLFLCSLFAGPFAALAQTPSPKGVLLFRPTPSTADSFVSAVEFTEIEAFPTVINGKNRNGGLIRIRPHEFVEKIDYPDLKTGSFSTPEQITSFKELGKKMLETAQKYPKAKPLLDPMIEEMKSAANLFNQGKFLINGEWRDPLMVTGPTNSNTLKPTTPLLPIRPILITKDGRSLEVNEIKENGDNSLQVFHKNGVARIELSNVTEESLKALSNDPIINKILFEANQRRAEEAKLAAMGAKEKQKLAERKAEEEQKSRIAYGEELRKQNALKEARLENYRKEFEGLADLLLTGKKLQFESSNKVCNYLIYLMSKEEIPQSVAGAKEWIKKRFGTPDVSSMVDYSSNQRMLTWNYFNYVKNPDTEKYTENLSFAFNDSLGVYFRVDGPEETAGGETNEFGVSFNTYLRIEPLFGKIAKDLSK